MKKVKVGLVGLMQLNFRGDKISVYNRSKREMQDLAQKLDFDLYCVNEGVLTRDQAITAKNELEAQGVDFVLIQNSSFSSGYLIQELGKTNAYIGLWAVPELTEEGPLPLNSFCGINMNAAVIKNYLKDYGIKYKWFYGYTENKLFIDRFKITLAAMCAIKNIKGSKIAQIGGLAPGFDNFYFDERIMQKKFGVTYNGHHEFDEIKSRMLSYTDTDIEKELMAIDLDYKINDSYAKENTKKMAKLYKAYQTLINENGYAAIASSCWPKFRPEIGMVPCAVFGKLNDEMIPTACEGDVYSALSMLALKYIANYTPILMDLSDVDFEKNGVFLWHCGVGSKAYTNKKLSLEQHFNPGPYTEEKGWQIMAPVLAMEFDEQHATVFRFTGEGDKMLLLEGDFKHGKKTHDGSRGWLYNLQMNEKDIDAKSLVDTIMSNGFHHHYPLVKGNYSRELMEFCFWMDIIPLDRVEYKEYAQ
jgi:L-fucose isomerase-like protein